MSHLLSEPFRRCWAEIDLDALRHNVGAIRDHVGPNVNLMAIVKANAYGHGVVELARELRYLVEMFGVASATEALQLRRVAPNTPIVVLGPALAEERDTMVRNGFIPVLSTLEEARAYSDLAQSLELKAPYEVHLKVDTGMGRIGVWHEEALDLAKKITSLPGLKLTGVATHLPVPDEDERWTRKEIDAWNRLLASFKEAGLEVGTVHALASGGIVPFNHQALGQGSGTDMVRPGLILYGVSPFPEFQEKLQAVLTWKSRVTLVRQVPKGRSVSYGRTFITQAPMRIATICAGYADGYQRHLSGTKADVLIRGHRCRLLGRVTMDQILVDVTAVPEAVAGDEVVLLGRQGDEEITATELAQKSGTIPWEIFTSISPRVMRYYI